MTLPPLTRAVRWTNLLLTALLGLTLARLTWHLIPGPEKVGTAPIPDAPASQAASTAGEKGLGDIANLHLFGQTDPPAIARRTTPVDAPETRLNLSLRGLMATGDGQRGYAIIGDSQGQEGFYRVNSKLPGGAALVEIRRDRVILQRGEQFETLKLPREMAEFAAVTKSARTPAASAETPQPEVTSEPEGGNEGGAAPEARLAAYRDRLMTDPSELGRLAQMQPVMQEGALKGYRLSPGTERELFRHAGLQPGDIVTSINGIPLSDPGMLGQVFQQLSSVDRFSITVERGGRVEQVAIDLGTH